MTLAAAPDAIQGAVAAGILGCGSVILGASETAGRLFLRIDALAREKSLSLEDAAAEVVRELRAAKQAIPGYGHPLHKARDPRVARLFAVAAEAGAPGRFIAIAEAVEKVLPGTHRPRPAPERLGRDPRGAARRRLSGRGVEGRADPGAHAPA